MAKKLYIIEIENENTNESTAKSESCCMNCDYPILEDLLKYKRDELRKLNETIERKKQELEEEKERELRALIDDIFKGGLKDLHESFELLRNASSNLKNLR